MILDPRIDPEYPDWIQATCNGCRGVGQVWCGDLYDCKECDTSGGYWVNVKTGRNHAYPRGKFAKGKHTREEIDQAITKCKEKNHNADL